MLFCFNAVDNRRIDNQSFVSHSVRHVGTEFNFSSGWYYAGEGEQQVWQDQHAMVAVSFNELATLLEPYFEVHVLEHDYQCIIPWDDVSGNALFACVKI